MKKNERKNDFTKRSTSLEWMDLKGNFYSLDEYRNCLFQLDRIGRFLGGDKATFSTLNKLLVSPSSFLDIGCGGGFFALSLAAKYPNSKVVGIDIDEEAISFANENLNKFRERGTYPRSEIEFLHTSLKELKKTASFEVAIATLVCHHFLDADLVVFLKEAISLTAYTLILNDLHRHSLATAGFAFIAPIFFPNRMIWHDGLLSIRRSFTRKDWKLLLKAAGVLETEYAIKWHWLFRWIVTIDAASIKKRKGDGN